MSYCQGQTAVDKARASQGSRPCCCNTLARSAKEKDRAGKERPTKSGAAQRRCLQYFWRSHNSCRLCAKGCGNNNKRNRRYYYRVSKKAFNTRLRERQAKRYFCRRASSHNKRCWAFNDSISENK